MPDCGVSTESVTDCGLSVCSVGSMLDFLVFQYTHCQTVMFQYVRLCCFCSARL